MQGESTTASLQAMPPYPWQVGLWQELCSQADASRLSHAVLLSAGEGLGIGTFAKAFGQYLLCLSPHRDLACGKCKSCHLCAVDGHPDLHTISLVDKAKQIKVDQIRELSQKVSQTPQQGNRKVFVLDPADALNINAANALLKNLEEPAGDTVFLLVTNRPSQLLPTIASRCTKQNLGKLDTTIVKDWLQRAGIENAEEALKEFNGAPLRALLWQDEAYKAFNAAVLSGLVGMCKGHVAPLGLAQTWANFETDALVELLIAWLESLIRGKTNEDFLLAQLRELSDLMAKVDTRLLIRLRDSLMLKRAQILRNANFNKNLVAEEIALDWWAICKRVCPGK